MLFVRRSKKDSEGLRREHLCELFVARYPKERTANDVLNFFLWLRWRSPDLLPREKQGNSYQKLKDELKGFYFQE